MSTKPKHSSKTDWVISEKVDDTNVLFRRSSINQSKSKDGHLFHHSKPQLYCWRWLILIFYYIANFTNQIPYEICVPISENMQKLYHVSEFQVTLAANCYMLIHPFLSFSSSQLTAERGWAFATKIGIVFSILGCGIKLLVNQTGFWIILLGQILCGIGRPLIFNCQASMAMHWFTPKSRVVIITGLNLVHTLSMIVSIIIPSYIFAGYQHVDDDDNSEDEGRKLAFRLTFVEFLVSLIAIPGFLVLRNKPPTPPSKIKKTELQVGFFKNLRILMMNRNFLLIIAPFSLYFGCLKSILVLMESLLAPFGYDQKEVSIAAALPLIAGLVGQASMPIAINKLNRRKLCVSILLFIVIVCTIGLFFALRSEQIWLVYLVVGILSFCVMPTIPIMMDISCDVVFPVNTAFAVGSLYMGSTLLSVVISQLLSLVSEQRTNLSVAIVLMVVASLCFIGFLMFLFVSVKDYEPVKVAMAESGSKLSLNFRNPSSLSFYQESTLFNCSFQVGLIGEAPTINLEEDVIDEEEEDDGEGNDGNRRNSNYQPDQSLGADSK